jgi:hypothetical protein
MGSTGVLDAFARDGLGFGLASLLIPLWLPLSWNGAALAPLRRS